MLDNKLCAFLNQQIPVLLILALGPGLGYVGLGWLYGSYQAAVVWYIFVGLSGLIGYRLYRRFDIVKRTPVELGQWYTHLKYWYYLSFALWGVIFIIYVNSGIQQMQYIAVFTELGASAVASALLIADRKLYLPIIWGLMSLLAIYFLNLMEWYAYVLAIFTLIFAYVLVYSANNSHRLLLKTRFRATHDALTELKNRYFLVDYLQDLLTLLNNKKYHSFLLMIDLDHFKTINDSLGHETGDELLKAVSKRLQASVLEDELVARLGGDEFIVVGDYYDNEDACQLRAKVLADTIVLALRHRYNVGDNELYISASIGVSEISPNTLQASEFIKRGDIAMYEAKSRGRNGVFTFNEEMTQRVERHLQIDRALHSALDNNEFYLNYQPQYDHHHKIIGVEVLARWTNKACGAVSPDEFISIAEQNGVIVELGNYIIASAFRTLADWHKKGVRLQQFSINISLRQFLNQNFVEDIESILALYLPKELHRIIVFEITESLVAENMEEVIQTILRLRQKGMRFSMDDFGTGYSSLAYLKNMPIDEVKIDRAFIQDLINSQGDQAMIRTIVNIADTFSLSVVAEGIETEEQLAFCHEAGCNMYQGYYFSKPLSKQDIEQRFIAEQ